ncbi:hypothetical protein ACIBO4_03035 [Streptomyces sp. NPDC050149]|uniref:hypothetical protein n=1 Tax=Streptomyces sp. NPDC050149 TaxID=3365603 RepID=UPI0037893D4A
MSFQAVSGAMNLGAPSIEASWVHCEAPANRFIDFIEATLNAPVNTEELGLQELFIPSVGWPPQPFDGRHCAPPRGGGTRREHKDLTGKRATAGIA